MDNQIVVQIEEKIEQIKRGTVNKGSVNLNNVEPQQSGGGTSLLNKLVQRKRGESVGVNTPKAVKKTEIPPGYNKEL